MAGFEFSIAVIVKEKNSFEDFEDFEEIEDRILKFKTFHRFYSFKRSQVSKGS